MPLWLFAVISGVSFALAIGGMLIFFWLPLKKRLDNIDVAHDYYEQIFDRYDTKFVTLIKEVRDELRESRENPKVYHSTALLGVVKDLIRKLDESHTSEERKDGA